MPPNAPSLEHRTPARLPGRVAAARVAAGLVVVLLALLQALGPFLHAHSRAAHGADGLHLHLVGAGQAALVVDDGPRQSAALPMAAPDEGSAVFLTTEYRRDMELSPVLQAFACDPVRPTAGAAVAGEGAESLRWPAAAAQAPPTSLRHRLPLATAPPLA